MKNSIKFDYSKLRGKIVEKYGTIGNFAQAAKLPTSTISLYLNNKYPWKQDVILIAAEALDIPQNEIPLYFFTPVVQWD